MFVLSAKLSYDKIALLYRIRQYSNRAASYLAVFEVSLRLLLDFSLTVKAAPHECVIRTSQPYA